MRAVLVLLLLAAVSCASTGERGTATRERYRITLEEIVAAPQTNAFDLVRVLRPGWLRVRGVNSFTRNDPISVFVDGVRMGGPEALQTIPKMHLEELRFYKASEAQLKFGLDNTNGAIAVLTRRG